MFRHSLITIATMLALAVSCKPERPQLTVSCGADNDLVNLLKAEKVPLKLCHGVQDALESAPQGSGVMLLADVDTLSGNVLSSENLELVKEKQLRVFVECPIVYGSHTRIGSHTLNLERIVVLDSLRAELPSLSLLSFNKAVLRDISIEPDSTLLVAAKVAGFNDAVYGLENTPTEPVLFFSKDGVLVSTTCLSQCARERLTPEKRMKALLEHICEYLCGRTVELKSFRMLVHPSFAEGERLSRKDRKEAVRRGVEWYSKGKFLVDASWKDEYVGRYMGDGTMPIGPQVRSDAAVGDGSLGVLEGHMSAIYHDGSQMYRYWMRADVQGESAYAFASAASLLGEPAYAEVASNLLDYTFREYRDGVRSNPFSPSYGLVGWAYTHKGTYYGDDNARLLLGALGASALLGSDRWDTQIIECIVANFRTSGVNGFRSGMLLDDDIQANGWQHYYDATTINLHPHFESWLWACYLWLYQQCGYEEILTRVERGVQLMMEGYPDEWSWTNGIQQERARMILPLAWLYRVSPTEQHRQWLSFMADELLRNQVECGAIREELGNPAKGGFGRTPSNALYGVTEAPLIFDNGDPVCDMLYTTNFAFVGLYEAAAATGDPKYWDAVRRMGDFLVRIQVSSKEFENVDGAWFRAFDYEDWDYWASNADAGWGAWSTLTGWIQSWIVGTLARQQQEQSLWELINSKQLQASLPSHIISGMLER